MARNDAQECAALSRNSCRPYYLTAGDLLNHHREKFKVRGLVGLQPVRLTIIHGFKTPVYNLLIDGFYNRAAWAVMRERGGKA
ncbi:MAG: hypothetical protein IKY92_03690 [Akkermansia sp.]|nr:hypothetical protein [Akkermansia sp.]